jgi:two-component system sensor histidine kinase BaeS
MIDTLMPMDICTCLHDAVSSFEDRFKDRNITVDTSELAESGLIINGDSNRIKQVFINLLENSLRYTDDGGTIKISSKKDHPQENPSQVVIRFEDSAPAVPQAVIEQIFERFFRVESSRSRDFGGAGLGLSISKSIVEAHNGAISAAPSVLGGLKIEIRLPLVGSGRAGGDDDGRSYKNLSC